MNAGPRTPESWPELARRFEPTVFAAAPGVYRRILKYGQGLKDSFARLRHAVTAGEALSESIAEGWREATGKPLLEALGMSEVSTFVSTPPDRHAGPGQVGWPQPGRHVAVLDEDGVPVPRGGIGTLAVHRDDPGLMLGYWEDGAPRLPLVCDWFVTGDLVRMGGDGAITYVGRADDRMNAQGYRVDPSEVEAALQRCAGIDEVAVTELAVSDGLSVIAAWIVPGPGGPPLRDDLFGEIAAHIASYKCPREVFVVEDLPRTPNGKIKRRALPGWNARRL